ncbi:nuclear distribution protein nudE-like 1 isoform X1 [Vanessa tameamea]|uniref:Nuclear distribution protein nudE-like 1 isoform X1 n=1 Tax=Vanessa tameamea TaxID=334116 RepID=A0A8B8HV20_VANTA|nr:nuclear distribution protein nudE-like 1 isoform X1 [Vanessa tameamea]
MESPKQLEQESVEYWKEQAKHYEQKARDIQQELDEYTENSAQLEKELEASLEQVEKQNRDLDHQNQRLQNKIDDLKNKLDRSQHETNALENELKALNIEKEKQAIYIRELEQKNDDLERGQRIISESVSCIETLLNQAYERNAVLESEVDEMENLRVRLQRATDEARDLKQELKVIEKIPISKKEDSSTNENICNGLSTRSQVEIETQTSITSPRREVNGNAMTPSSRVSAINIVGDLLRKVGLERFLCRECGKVKCSCDLETNGEQAVVQNHPPLDSNIENESTMTVQNNDLDDPIEYRKQGELTRQYSRSEQLRNNSQKALPLSTHRSSEQPFVRSYQAEHGKLRRSFIVRSRESLENFLNFTSTRKGPDQSKGKQMLRQQF